MGKPTGFLEYKRETAKVEAPKDRIKHFNEFRTPLKKRNSRNRAHAAWNVAFRSARPVQ